MIFLKPWNFLSYTKNAMSSSLVGQLHLNTFCIVGKTISNLFVSKATSIRHTWGLEKLNRVFSNDTTGIIRQRELFVSSK
jgi:hypothetical protein